jgi:hypothetical protein
MMISHWARGWTPRVEIDHDSVSLWFTDKSDALIRMSHQELRQLAAVLTEAITRLPAGGG